jgi:hypothetical protein
MISMKREFIDRAEDEGGQTGNKSIGIREGSETAQGLK